MLHYILIILHICAQAEEERDAALKLAEEGGAQGGNQAARLSQLEDQLSTGAQREGVLQSQLADALQQCADQVRSATSPHGVCMSSATFASDQICRILHESLQGRGGDDFQEVSYW